MTRLLQRSIPSSLALRPCLRFRRLASLAFSQDNTTTNATSKGSRHVVPSLGPKRKSRLAQVALPDGRPGRDRVGARGARRVGRSSCRVSSGLDGRVVRARVASGPQHGQFLCLVLVAAFEVDRKRTGQGADEPGDGEPYRPTTPPTLELSPWRRRNKPPPKQPGTPLVQPGLLQLPPSRRSTLPTCLIKPASEELQEEEADRRRGLLTSLRPTTGSRLAMQEGCRSSKDRAWRNSSRSWPFRARRRLTGS